MADMPDLSHLTAEERAQIEAVMMRDRQETECVEEIMRWVVDKRKSAWTNVFTGFQAQTGRGG